MTVIRVEHLSKQYRLGLIGGGTLRADLERWWAMKRGKEDPLTKIGDSPEKARLGERFWALKDVSFEVKQGEVLGIIGRNGAGKSTLLKILSRVTSPTEGAVKVKGRIGSLLEVGTGFHGELTGRENTYLNGAILGMTKREVTKKLDEIVAFAEMDKFIDTPVKRYSSGMYVRLAFAVAAHLDPEILIVDEVLAVGDAAFQKKCLGKMGEVSREGRTVLFVSHNMHAISGICERTLLMATGAVDRDGPASEVTAEYLSLAHSEGRLTYKPEVPVGDDTVKLVASRLLVSDCATTLVTNGMRLVFEAEIHVGRPADLAVCVPVHRDGELAFLANAYHQQSDLRFATPGRYAIRFSVPPYLLNPGRHVLGFYAADERAVRGHHVRVEDAVVVDIHDDGSRRGDVFSGSWPGAVSPMLSIAVSPRAAS